VDETTWAVSEVAGGAMAQRLERIAARGLAVIRKWAPTAEIAALTLAQSVRPEATAVPELIETGADADGTWFITPEYRGSPSAELTSTAVNSLARLHAHFYGVAADHQDIPVIDLTWWQALCTHWVQPAIEQHARSHGVAVADQARRVLNSCRTNEALARSLSRITPTLLHGDIHPGNVLTDGHQTHLIDWGSARFGTPLLDLLNLVASDSPQLHAYLDAFGHHGSRPLEPDEIAAGRQWAAVQIPVQYLPWTLENRPTVDVTSALAAIERALDEAAG
jgi:Ser/Thr protein kinase RdoA (MazF antagonist)